MKMPWSRKKSANIAPEPDFDPESTADDPAHREAKAYISEVAWQAIAPGFQKVDDIIADLSELADDDDDLLISGGETEAIVEALWHKRLHELQQPSERHPSDNDRVAAAFAELEIAGIIARMNLGFDQTEGSHEARQLAEAAGARGFVYFHRQDANRLAYPDAVLFLGWGVVGTTREEYDAAAIRLGEEIRTAVERQGLTVRWNGTLERRHEVLHLNWRMPLQV